MSNTNPDFCLKPIADLLDVNCHFFIPSYQRGYRWGENEVKDLLDDISGFARNAQRGEFYCLQPIVVRKRTQDGVEGWEVIDGQQRLTTIYLLLRFLKSNNSDIDTQLYDIHYDTRPTLDFENVDFKSNIDSYYIHNAQGYIQDWFKNNKVKKSRIEEVLFDKYEVDDCEPQVKVIWYVAESDQNLDSIKIFNNLNKGKISLTNAELIKALFILSSHENKTELVLEWNLIEKELQNNHFWRFLTNVDYNPATRIDLLFDFLISKPKGSDKDFTYRRFQSLYDGRPEACWAELGVHCLQESWLQIKQSFELFRYWYEDPMLYHYIGFLLAIGVTHRDLYDKTVNSPKDKVRNIITELIKSKLNLSEEQLKELAYDSPYDVRKVLLLFNVESSAFSKTYRFPFDQYKEEKWDIEHIASITDNTMQSTVDKIKWLSYLKVLEPQNKDQEAKIKRGLDLLLKLETTGKEMSKEFDECYKDLLNSIEDGSINDESKNSIANLVLLDANTNRSYGNALFQTKRKEIIEKDKTGNFIPPCTKNVFLKYYSSDDLKSSQWKNTWSDSDAKNYLEEMVKVLTPFLKQ